MVFGAGLTAGLLAQIGHAINSDSLHTIGRVASWALPFEGLYAAGLHALISGTSGLTGVVLQLGPVRRLRGGRPGLIAWAFAYMLGVLALAAWPSPARPLIRGPLVTIRPKGTTGLLGGERGRGRAGRGRCRPQSAIVRSSSARTIFSTVSTPGLALEGQAPDVGAAEADRVGAQAERLERRRRRRGRRCRRGSPARRRPPRRSAAGRRARRSRRRPGGRRGWRRRCRRGRARAASRASSACWIPLTTIGSEVSSRSQAEVVPAQRRVGRGRRGKWPVAAP